jgi:hypothetical protein
LPAGALLAPACPNSKYDRADGAHKQCDLHRAESAFENRRRQKQAAIVDKDAADGDALANIRESLENGVVPEEELQQQR